MTNGNVVLDKSYAFALRIIHLYVDLQEKREYHLSAQIVRSGTSIGANIEEAIAGASRKDFKAKLDIAHKEARETRYWLRLLRDGSFIDGKLANSLIADCEELLRILIAILKSIKNSLA